MSAMTTLEQSVTTNWNSRFEVLIITPLRHSWQQTVTRKRPIRLGVPVISPVAGLICIGGKPVIGSDAEKGGI